MLFLSILQNINIFPIQCFIHASDSTEFPAHRTGIFVFWCTVIADLFRCFWINGAFPLFFPVESSSCVTHGIIQISCMGNLFRNICGMGSDTGSDDALFDIVYIWQCKMFRGGYIAQECCAGSGCDCTADSSSNMVITGRDVCDDGTKHIEGAPMQMVCWIFMLAAI